MANFDFNYFYDVYPTQQYPEYGIPAVTTLPLEYVYPFYNVLYTGVTSYELNGTTYYNYSVYELPILCSSASYSVSSDVSSDQNNENDVYVHMNESNVLEQEIDVSENVLTEDYEEQLFVYDPLFDVENYVEKNVENYDIGGEEDEEEKLFAYDGNKFLNGSADLENDNIEEKDEVKKVFVYEGSQILDWSADVESDNKEEDDKTEKLFAHKGNQIMNCSVDVESDNKEEQGEVQKVLAYERNQILDWSADVESDNKEDENEIETLFVYEGNQFLNCSVDVESDNIEKEDEVEKVFVYERNKILDWIADVESDNKEKEDEVEKLFVCEENQALNWSADVESDNIEEEDEVEKVFVYEESQILDWSADVESGDKDEEDEVETLSVYEENNVLDWTADVENDDIEEENENSNKINYLTIDDISPYDSPEVIKYLKEKLYLEALSGHTFLKECLPIVDVLPTIKEESESIKEFDTFELSVDDLKEREETLSRGIETDTVLDKTFDTSESFIHNYAIHSAGEDVKQIKINIANLIEKDTETEATLETSQPFLEKLIPESTVNELEQIKENTSNPIEKYVISDLTVDTSQPLTENIALESAGKLFAQVKEHITNTTEEDLPSVPAFDSYQRNFSENGQLPTQKEEILTIDNKLLIKETKLSSSGKDITSSTSAEKTDLSVTNALKSAETDDIFNAVLQKPKIQLHEKEHLSKIQKNGFNIKEELIATDGKSLCPNSDMLMIPSAEGEKKNQRNVSENGQFPTQREEILTIDNKLLIKETKLSTSEKDFTSSTSAEKTDLSVKNALKSAETHDIFNVVLQKPKMQLHEKEHLSKIQKNGFNIMEELIATDGKSPCPNSDMLMIPSAEGEKKKEVILNPNHINHGNNTTCHVLQENGLHGECLSESIVEETTESNEQVSTKKKKKKSHNLRKWLSRFSCCTRKKT